MRMSVDSLASGEHLPLKPGDVTFVFNGVEQ